MIPLGNNHILAPLTLAMTHHASPDQRRRELDDILSRLNALEITTTDKFHLAIIGVLRFLVQNQLHSVSEMEHYRKALDLITQEVFRLKK